MCAYVDLLQFFQWFWLIDAQWIGCGHERLQEREREIKKSNKKKMSVKMTKACVILMVFYALHSHTFTYALFTIFTIKKKVLIYFHSFNNIYFPCVLENVD